MDGLGLSAEEERELKRRQTLASRWVFGIGAGGILLGAVGFTLSKLFLAWRAGETQAYVDGDLMLIPSFIALLAVVLMFSGKQPQPRDRIQRAMVERGDRRLPWFLLFEGVMGIVVAALFAAKPNFHISVVLAPLFAVGMLLNVYRRGAEEFDRDLAAQAMTTGFVATFISLVALVAVAWFAPAWLARLVPMALAAPVAVAAGAFSIRSWSADRRA